MCTAQRPRNPDQERKWQKVNGLRTEIDAVGGGGDDPGASKVDTRAPATFQEYPWYGRRLGIPFTKRLSMRMLSL